MAKECFVSWRPQAAAQEVVEQANAILEEYGDQGFTLTVRQLFYQFVARDFVANSQPEYKRLQRIFGEARDAGLIDWDAIEDRTREVNTHAIGRTCCAAGVSFSINQAAPSCDALTTLARIIVRS
jgi:hypothetical protein